MFRDAARRLEALPAVKKKAILKAMTTLEILLLFFEEISGHELYKEFQSWSEFSQRTYDLFIREILLNLRDANHGYG